MKYERIYQLTHDIDWFCKIGNIPMHFASNCGMLPRKVDNREVNRKIQELVVGAPNLVEREHIIINDVYVRTRIGEEASENAFNDYVRTFVEMAMKGFMSFDRLTEDGEDTYVWIAKPSEAVEVNFEGIPTYPEDVCGLFQRMTGDRYLSESTKGQALFIA